MPKHAVTSPVLTPKLTPDVTTTSYVSTSLWDERPAKYAKNVFKHVCVFLIILSICEGVAAFAISQSLKNFFQKLGWSNKGSTSMKLTYDSASQFMTQQSAKMRDLAQHVAERQPLRPHTKQHTAHWSPAAWILHNQEPGLWPRRPTLPRPQLDFHFWTTMGKSNAPQSPVLTPQTLTPQVDAVYSTKLWDARAPKYATNVMRKVCIYLFIVTFCEELAGYGVNQSLKNFFQKLGWSNKGSNSMKLTYDSLSQFACIVAAFIADEYLGKYKTLLGAASFSSVGFVLIVIAALPSVLENQLLSKFAMIPRLGEEPADKELSEKFSVDRRNTN
ncbi:hypothetical protein KRP22_006952 [Phytophthora ramorum]|nr:hypothetical protein KRP22_15318 [Phytophthora ramorum]